MKHNTKSEIDRAKMLLLVIEDDLTRADRWKRLAQEADWRVEVTGSLEGAVAYARRHAARIRMVVVDLMLPFYEADLKGSLKLRGERSELGKRIIAEQSKTNPDKQALRDLDAEMSALDGALRRLIVLDSGLLFLEEAMGRGWLKTWKYAICSATDKANGEAALDEKGIKQVGEYLGWYSKPIQDEKLVELLKNHRDGKILMR